MTFPARLLRWLGSLAALVLVLALLGGTHAALVDDVVDPDAASEPAVVVTSRATERRPTRDVEPAPPARSHARPRPTSVRRPMTSPMHRPALSMRRLL